MGWLHGDDGVVAWRRWGGAPATVGCCDASGCFIAVSVRCISSILDSTSKKELTQKRQIVDFWKTEKESLQCGY
jgi:hypothetical protein